MGRAQEHNGYNRRKPRNLKIDQYRLSNMNKKKRKQ